MEKKIFEMETKDRPREKLLKYGAEKLSDNELLMILLRHGGKGYSVGEIAKNILPIIDKKGIHLQQEDLVTVKGVGTQKSTTIAAAYELVRRRIREGGFKVTRPADVYPLMRHLGDRKQEHFICVTLNGANEVMEVRTVTIGLLNRTQVHPREVFADAIAERAASIVIAHNHPSGNLQPSTDDLKVTKRLREAGELLGIPVLDHLIFSSKGYYSLADAGQL
ncbi:MAG: DNA repair protein RadC [Proteobacteria bacterium]|nr:DNA repair protein RadC [Pseudomonadota bacterium]